MKGKLLKTLAILGCLALGAGLVACGGKGNGGDGTSSSVSESVSDSAESSENVDESVSDSAESSENVDESVSDSAESSENVDESVSDSAESSENVDESVSDSAESSSVPAVDSSVEDGSDDSIGSEHEHNYTAAVTAPTCTEQGFTTYTCDCGDSYVNDYVDELGHSFTNYVSNNDATCTEDGTKTAKCDNGCGETDTIADEGSTLDHDYGDWIKEMPTICGENGEKAHYHCSKCEQNFDANYNKIEDITILATEEHEYGEWITVQSGGCSAVSYKAKICYKCAHYVLDSDVDVDLVHPHEFELIEKAPTCTEGGIVYRFKCKNCNFVAAEELVEALGHDLSEYEYFNAGDTHYQICKRCEDEIHERHTCYDWTRVKEPNCYETGLAEGVCLKCGLAIEKVLPIVHDWQFTEYETEPTCTENGVSLYTCSICSTTKTETAYKLGHNHEFNSVITAPTCTEIGLDLYVCSRCGNEKEKTVSSLGHDWDDGIITIEPDCYKTGNKHYECERDGCNATKDKELAKKHTFNDGEIIIEPSCTINGKIKFTCQICQSSKELDLGVKHNTTYHAKTKATCTQDGNHEYWYCEDCNTYFSDVDSNSCSFSYDGRNYYFDTKIYTYQESTLEALTIVKIGHDIPDYFNEYDDDNHWQECLNDCGLTQNINEHEFEESFVVEVESVAGGYQHTLYHRWKCLYCDYYINGDMDANGDITPNDGITVIHEHNTYEPIAPTSPSCVMKGYTTGLLCGECSEVLVEQQEIPALGHNFVDAICTRCGLNSKLGTPGLKYTLNSDGQSYSCSGMGTAKTSFIVIGSEYNGLPVTKIASSAFKNQYNLMSVIIPVSIESIDSSAFYGCYKLVEIYNLSSLSIETNSSANGYVGYYALDIYNDINTKSKLVELSSGYVFYLGEETNYLIGYCGNETALNLPNIFAGEEYDIYEFAFYYNDNISSVAIGKRTTNIGEYAFYNCTSLTEIVIPDSVTSICYVAFYNCSKLTNIYITDIAAWCNILGGSFMDGSSNKNLYLNNELITEIIIPNSVTSICYAAFRNCTSLTSVVISNSVTSIGEYAFRNCTSLTRVVIPDSVTNISNYAFYDCDNLTSIVIPDRVTNIGYKAFISCDSLTSINVDEKNKTYKSIDGNLYSKDGKTLLQYAIGKTATTFVIPDSVIFIRDGAFHDCTSLTSVVIPDSVTSIGQSAFSGCSSLTSITIPSSVTSIGEWAFSDCSSLTSIIIPDSVKSIDDYVFSGCSGLTEIVIHDSVTSIGSHAFEDCDSLTSVVIPDGVTSIGSYAFEGCGKLTSVVIPDSLTSIGYYAFRNCGSLTSVVIGDSVTSIGSHAFHECYNLVEVVNKSPFITVEMGKSSNGYIGYYALAVYNSGDTFETKLSSDNGYLVYTDGEEKILVGYVGAETNLVLPSYITKIKQYAFYNCSRLTSVVIGDGVTSIGEYAFSNCYKLVEIVNKSPSITVEIGGSSNGYIGYYALAVYTSDNAFKTKLSVDNGYLVYTDGEEKILVGYAGSETDLVLPSYITQINKYAFAYCSNLTSVVIPSSVTSIGYYAFEDCDSLTSVVISDGVTTIDGGAFEGCGKLTIVVIPDSVTEVGSYAFTNCPNLSYQTYGNVQYLGNKDNPYLVAICSADRSYSSYIIHEDAKLIAGGAFSLCYNVTRVVIPDGVTFIGWRAFYNCSRLTSVVIGDGVTSIGGYAFGSCRSLTSVVIGDGVTSIGEYAFSNCYKLVEIVNKSPFITVEIGGSSNGYIGYYALAVYTSDNAFKTKLSVDNGYLVYTDGEEKILVGYAGSETDLVLPSYITQINKYAFAYCSNLTSVVIPSSVTSIGQSAFSGCSSLTSITIPSSVTSIGEWAFFDCSKLTSITFSDTSTWYRTNNKSNWENKKGGTETDLTTPSTNATYFKSTYYYYYWYKL